MGDIKRILKYAGTPEDKINEQAETIEWGFDLTNFGSKENFIKLLQSHNIHELPTLRVKRHKEWRWHSPSLTMITANNPITGKHASGIIEPEVGYASYIGITGEEDAVKRLADDIREYLPKGESKYRRDFI